FQRAYPQLWGGTLSALNRRRMRFVLVLLGVIAVLAVSRTAAAENNATNGWASPAVAIALLDGWRATAGHVDFRVKRAIGDNLGVTTSEKDRPADPGEELSAYVERMWSQVRAYKRPGGAEFRLRGKF